MLKWQKYIYEEYSSLNLNKILFRFCVCTCVYLVSMRTTRFLSPVKEDVLSMIGALNVLSLLQLGHHISVKL